MSQFRNKGTTGPTIIVTSDADGSGNIVFRAGVDDPAVAIEAAWARLAIFGGGVLVTKGAGETWTTQTTIDSQGANVTWISDWGLTIQPQNGLNANVVTITHDYVTLIGLKINGNGANQTGGHVIQFSQTIGGGGFRLNLSEAYDTGLEFYQSSEFFAIRVEVRHTYVGAGITSWGVTPTYSEDGIISECYVYNAASAGTENCIHIRDSNYIIVADCVCDTATDVGISCEGNTLDVYSNIITGCTVRNAAIVGILIDGSTANDIDNYYSVVQGCTIYNCPTGLSHYRQVFNFTVGDVTIRDCAIGVFLQFNVQKGVYTNVQVYNSTSYGGMIENDTVHCEENSFVNCVFDGCALGFRSDGNAKRTMFTSCKFKNSTNQGFQDNFASHDLIFSACQFEDNGAEGLFSRGNRILVDGCRFISNGADGLHMSSGYHNGIITNNLFYYNDDNGIQLADDNDGFLIHDNYFIENGQDAGGYGVNIATANASGNSVMHNRYNGNVTGCILDNGTDTATPEWNETVENPDSNIGRHPAEQMLDGVETTVRMGFTCPIDFQELVTAEIVIVPAGSGNLRWDAFTDYGRICKSEAYNAHSDSVGATTTSGLTDTYFECLDISGALDIAALTPGDRVGLEFWRDGDNILDTIGATVYVIEVRLRYV